MISPLKIWQHPQPKHLWPALGGLSLLTHIGVIGLSLPYALTLMQTSGETDASSVIPIELVATDDTVQATTDSATLESSDEQSDSSTESNPIDVDGTSEAALESLNSDSESDASQPLSGRRTMSEYNERQIGENQTKPDPTDDGQTEPDLLNNNPTESRQGETQQGTENPENPSTPSSPAPAVTGNETPSAPTAIEEGTGTDLPTPDQGPREVSLQIMGATQPPENRRYDLKDTSPSLSPESENFTALVPESYGCDSVISSNLTLTYRVRVNADGSAAEFNPFDPDPESEREAEAIACLLKNAGFTFVPAQQDGVPVMNDDLLLTIQVQ